MGAWVVGTPNVYGSVGRGDPQHVWEHGSWGPPTCMEVWVVGTPNVYGSVGRGDPQCVWECGSWGSEGRPEPDEG